jgi:hypothetical protein
VLTLFIAKSCIRLPNEQNFQGQPSPPHLPHIRDSVYSQLRPLVVHVAGRVDAILWELGNLSREALFDGLENGLILWAAYE